MSNRDIPADHSAARKLAEASCNRNHPFGNLCRAYLSLRKPRDLIAAELEEKLREIAELGHLEAYCRRAVELNSIPTNQAALICAKATLDEKIKDVISNVTNPL